MHRSRIGVILVDYPEPDHQASLRFWAAVTGRDPAPEADSPYAALGIVTGAKLEVQRTGAGTPARIHLDVETDDVPAEVARLTGLGAVLAEERHGYSILCDPGGLVFCVVGVQTGEAFERDAASWH